MAQPFLVTQLGGALGAEVQGIDLGNLSDAQVTDIKELLLAHKVIFFPSTVN